LFGYLAFGEVKNLAIININIQSCFIGGGIAAQAGFGARIKNCYVDGNIKGFWTLGGIVGYTFWIDIYDCMAKVVICFDIRSMPSKIALYQEKFHKYPLSMTTDVNLWQASGGIVGYVANLSVSSRIENCIVAWSICGGEERWNNPIASKEGGADLTIINCEIIKDIHVNKNCRRDNL
jgi:hypothetical protein